jgi:hypothetical protein
MSHESLIAELASGIKPVTPLPSPKVRAARWVLVATLTVALGLAAKGLRQNWEMALADPWFLLTVALILATGVAAAMTAMALSVPGVVRASWMKWVPVTLMLAWGAVLAAEVLLAGTSWRAESWGVNCLWKTWGIAVGPAAVILWLAGRAAPLDWRWTGGLAALASLAFGVLGTELICPVSVHAHVFTWHFLPVAVTTGLTFLGVTLWARRR